MTQIKYIKKKRYITLWIKRWKKYPVGKIKSIDKRDYTIEHDYNNIYKKDKFWGRILLLDNYQVIWFNKKEYYEILLKYYIDEFILFISIFI